MRIRRRRRKRSDALSKSVQGLLAERRAVRVKEKGLVRALNSVLTKIGYEVVPVKAAARPGPRRGRKRGRRPGRPRGRRKRAAARAGRPRRRGRPRRAR